MNLALSAPLPTWRRRWRIFLRDRSAVAAGLVLLFLVVASACDRPLESWAGVSGIQPDLFSRFEPPSSRHLLGADDAGRDELARLLRGGQISLEIGALGALSAALLGTAIGAASGYARGHTDTVLMRITDFVIAIPHLPILLIVSAIDSGKFGFSAEFLRSGSFEFWRIVGIVSLLNWTGAARLMRAGTMAVTEREFVLAARAQGASAWWSLRVHIIPNALAPVIVSSTLAVGRVILTESGLSFLGLGIQPPMTSWGTMLTNAQELLGTAPLLAILPGAMIMVTVISVNFLGDALRSAFDPRELE